MSEIKYKNYLFTKVNLHKEKHTSNVHSHYESKTVSKSKTNGHPLIERKPLCCFVRTSARTMIPNATFLHTESQAPQPCS